MLRLKVIGMVQNLGIGRWFRRSNMDQLLYRPNAR